MRRQIASAAAAAVLAAACASDDAIDDDARIRTTVPAVTAAPNTTDVADSDDEVEPPPSSTATPTTTTADPTTTTEAERRAGDPTAASIALEVVVVDPESGAVGDTVVAIDDETRAAGERGLLGLAVDETALYVNFTDGAGNTRIDAFVLDDVGRPGERISLLTIEQPFGNHNGGSLAIGPDGHLYIGVGDGGGGGDPLDAAQDPTQALGSILRIDPTLGAERPYVAPDDNPYGDDGTVAEIFLTGVRNPWRFTFDPVTGDLWVADVGQNAWEEVTLLLAANGGGRGANLGWNLREGVEPFAGDRPPGNVDPVFVYGREGTPSGCSVTGGEVYRGTTVPELWGAYLFGDYCTAGLWAISVATGEVVFADLAVTVPGGDLVDFAVDPDGEIVALSLGGAVVRIVPR